ncbi:hypothetical protein [Marinimicrobium sp. ABcell2]|uniref:hypothetical protein n=1 Tax=Marinimicrobium sp. ABcell2 TaxID=3069751 RepID=UPI0027B5E709|nr:hypothetical protein [Marinimicrobium sp. ABcell2]MDQ2075740.1 hypothetical protein [Marinimicrobium sp. ABcell2]
MHRLISQHITLTSTNKEAIAATIPKKYSYEMDWTLEVFKELDWAYSTDADDIAVRYIKTMAS